MPRRLRGRCGGTAGAGGINSSAGGAGRPRVRALRFGAIGFRVMCASAAGRTFGLRILKAEWAARRGHTSVVDAAGAIYVLGGLGITGITAYYYQDVWASTDGGARGPTASGGGTPVGTTGVLGGTTGVLQWVLRRY